MHLTMLLETPDARKEAFATFLRQQQDPRSPQFHRWLQAEQIGERFGASADGHRDLQIRGCRWLLRVWCVRRCFE